MDGSRYGIDFTNRKDNRDFTEEEYEKIFSETSKIIEQNNSDPEFLSGAYYDRGHIYFIRGDYEKAVSDYSSSIQLKEQLILSFLEEALYSRGEALSILGQYNEALVDFEKAYLLNKNDGDAKKQIEILKDKINQTFVH